MDFIIRRQGKSLFFTFLLLILVSGFWTFLLLIERDQSTPEVILPSEVVFTEKETIEIKRHPEIPSLSESLVSWSDIPVDKNAKVLTWPLSQIPHFKDSDNASCIPRSFGYSKQQAENLFKTEGFYTCDKGKDFLSFRDNKLEINCPEGSDSSYVLGTLPEEEVLNDSKMRPRWKKYEGEVDSGRSEYAFGKCGDIKQGILKNKFLKSASDRAFNTTEKLKKEMNIMGKVRPLTVLFVLFDAYSRYHFYRNSPKTLEFLNSQAVNGTFSEKFTIYDFLINNAHAENTQPNLIPMFYGYNLRSHKIRLEGYSYNNQSDTWKFKDLQKEAIWKHYENYGFVTMFSYDTVWNYMTQSTGRKVLTDHVATNFWHASSEIFGYPDFMNYKRCIGNHYSHYYTLDYTKQFIRNYQENNKFAYIHLSQAHEYAGTIIKIVDDDLKEFLEDTLKYYNEKEEDLVIMLVGDHGKHVEPYDTYPEGYVENQLPFHILITNKELVNKMSADEFLKHNTQRLVSRFDWYMTLKHLATVPYGSLKPNSDLYLTWRSMTDSNHSLSLFSEKVDNYRECSDMKIPLHRCSCLPFFKVEEKLYSSEPLTTLGRLGIFAVNNRIKNDNSLEFCKKITFKEIIQAEFQELNDKDESKTYRIRVTIHEDEKASFEVYGLLTSKENLKKMMKKDEDGEIYPVANVVVENRKEEMAIQVQEIIRVDPYAGICEEIAATLGTKSAYCICRKPQNYDFTKNITPPKERIFNQLKKKLKVQLASFNETCYESCMVKDTICQQWGFELINKLEILKEPWNKDGGGYEIWINDTHVEEFNDIQILEYSNRTALSFEEADDGKYNLLFGNWTKMSCYLRDEEVQLLCPCV
ncbi:unnamed protein product [Blepharisma stoltei]|uniref:Sulfatase N-terminal domain-containing protein n=1 Tax=Blepharisma stoltei TaxID=1481888 RepID=A0AAU9K193_9CILI|nr:unnamed protein product [Blepharisma stoltei]